MLKGVVHRVACEEGTSGSMLRVLASDGKVTIGVDMELVKPTHAPLPKQ